MESGSPLSGNLLNTYDYKDSPFIILVRVLFNTPHNHPF